MKTISDFKAEIEKMKFRSAWDNGVKLYALEMLEQLEENRKYSGLDEHIHPLELKTELLNGAENWHDFSYGGMALIYDSDIAERLCTPSELKRKRGGELQPNKTETWLDVQSRALFQAYMIIYRRAK